MQRRLSAVLALVAFACVPAHAVLVDAGCFGDVKFLFDPASVRREGEHVAARVVIDSLSQRPTERKSTSADVLFDCGGQRWWVRDSTNKAGPMGSGVVVGGESYKTDGWIPAKPNTAAGTTLELVCAKAAGNRDDAYFDVLAAFDSEQHWILQRAEMTPAQDAVSAPIIVNFYQQGREPGSRSMCLTYYVQCGKKNVAFTAARYFPLPNCQGKSLSAAPPSEAWIPATGLQVDLVSRVCSDWGLWLQNVQTRRQRLPGDWREFRSEPGGFSVLFPGKPEIVTARRDADGVQTIFRRMGPDYAFLISLMRPAKGKGPKQPDEALFRRQVQGYLDSMGFDMTVRSLARVRIAGKPGLEAILDAPRTTHRVDVTASGDDFYMIVFQGARGLEWTADSVYMRDTFKLLK
jgi:hypothetical protein